MSTSTIISLIFIAIAIVFLVKIKLNKKREEEIYEKFYYMDLYGPDWDLKYYKDQKALKGK